MTTIMQERPLTLCRVAERERALRAQALAHRLIAAYEARGYRVLNCCYQMTGLRHALAE